MVFIFKGDIVTVSWRPCLERSTVIRCYGCSTLNILLSTGIRKSATDTLKITEFVSNSKNMESPYCFTK